MWDEYHTWGDNLAFWGIGDFKGAQAAQVLKRKASTKDVTGAWVLYPIFYAPREQVAFAQTAQHRKVPSLLIVMLLAPPPAEFMLEACFLRCRKDFAVLKQSVVSLLRGTKEGVPRVGARL